MLFVRVVVLAEFLFSHGTNVDREIEGAEDGEERHVDAFQCMRQTLIGRSVGVSVLVGAVETECTPFLHEC